MGHPIIAALLALMLGAVAAAAEPASRLSDEQRTRVSQAVARLNIAPLRKVGFAVNVGAEIPRSVKLRPLPYAAVSAAPQYRGHAFLRVEEDVLIVEPRSHKVVAVLPLARAADGEKRRINLTQQQRELIRAQVTKQTSKFAARNRATTGGGPQPDVVIGEPVPRAYTIERFPDPVYWQVPALRSYQYILRDKELYVVDPRKRRVIELLE
jgi:hypothetical protein